MFQHQMAISHLFGISECLSIAKSRIPDRCGFCIGIPYSLMCHIGRIVKKDLRKAPKNLHMPFLFHIFTVQNHVAHNRQFQHPWPAIVKHLETLGSIIYRKGLGNREAQRNNTAAAFANDNQ
jgi:hypothetical protein